MKLPELEFNIENKKKAAGCIVIILACIGYTIFNFLTSSTPPSSSPAIQDHGGQITNQASQTNKKNKQQSDSVAVNTNFPDSVLSVNPFVEINEFKQQAAEGMSQKESTFIAPAIPNMPPAGSMPLPVIPSMPSVANGRAAGEMPLEKPELKKVQGVLIGDEGSIAIMSDGSVVSEGETFADGRIAYIGGDGITLDNGNSFKYE